MRPARLPKTRDQMASLLADPDSVLRRRFGDRYAADLEIAARHLHGGLYWVASDMAALATAAARSLDTVRWAAQDRPAPTGLIVMDGGIGWIPYATEDLPVDAVSWGPAPGGLLLTMWVARSRIEQSLTEQGTALDPDHPVPALVPMLGDVVPVTIDEQPVDALPDRIRTIAGTVAAAWHLMQQPTLAGQYPSPIDRATARSYRRAGRPEPEVTIVDLRTLYRPTDPDQQPDEDPGRYSHRWIVTGHWRWQAHGRGREQRKRIYIPDYIKGPDGAPLLLRERVNVWRR